jgi:hypothetical protein
MQLMGIHVINKVQDIFVIRPVALNVINLFNRLLVAILVFFLRSRFLGRDFDRVTY